MTLTEAISRVIEQSYFTGKSIAGGMMPHSPWRTLSPRDISAGLDRMFGWSVHPSTVERFLPADHAARLQAQAAKFRRPRKA